MGLWSESPRVRFLNDKMIDLRVRFLNDLTGTSQALVCDSDTKGAAIIFWIRFRREGRIRQEGRGVFALLLGGKP